MVIPQHLLPHRVQPQVGREKAHTQPRPHPPGRWRRAHQAAAHRVAVQRLALVEEAVRQADLSGDGAAAYEARKASLGLIDFADMISGAERLLGRDPAVRQAVLDRQHVANGCGHQQWNHRTDLVVQPRQEGHHLRVKAQHPSAFGQDQKDRRHQQAGQDPQESFSPFLWQCR